MITPQAFEQAVQFHRQQLLEEAARERLAARARPKAPGLRHWLAVALYRLAARLSAGVADAVTDARNGSAGFRVVVNCNGVEYWWPTAARI